MDINSIRGWVDTSYSYYTDINSLKTETETEKQYLFSELSDKWSEKLSDKWLENNSTLFFSIKKGLINTVKQLLTDENINPNMTINGKNAIIIAAYYEQEEIMELLLSDVRINPFYNDNLALKTIVHNQNSTATRILILYYIFLYFSILLILG